MKFEEILPLIRQGKKATLPYLKKSGEYYIMVYAGLLHGLGGGKWPTLAKVTADGYLVPALPFSDLQFKEGDIYAHPQSVIYLNQIMSEDWEIIEDDKLIDLENKEDNV